MYKCVLCLQKTINGDRTKPSMAKASAIDVEEAQASYLEDLQIVYPSLVCLDDVR